MSAAGAWLCLLRAFCIATFVHSPFGHSSICSVPVTLATFVLCSRPSGEAGEYGGKCLRVVFGRYGCMYNSYQENILGIDVRSSKIKKIL